MLTVVQARKKNMRAGEPIPMPWGALVQNGSAIRRGELTLIAAAPGVGKSVLAQTLVQVGNGDGTKLRSLYFSADTNASTFFNRSAAIATGYQLSDIDAYVRQGAVHVVEPAVRTDTSHMMVSFDSDLTEEHILEQIDAYATVWGDYPELIVIDNLSDYVSFADDPGGALTEGLSLLKDISSRANCGMVALHHVVGQYDSGDEPVPQSGLIQKISKIPAQIWTLHKGSGAVNVSVVKNREGPADSTGRTFISLPTDMSRARIG